MEGVRNKKLENVCEGIAEVRSEMARLRAEEGSFETEALRYMRDAKIHTFRHSGVELARVPGEEVLRVRTSKKGATAETEEDQGQDQVDDSGNEIQADLGNDDQGERGDDDGEGDERE